MELLLIRHGKAEAHGHPSGDGARDLVEKGEGQSRKVGRFLKREGLVPDLALTSPLVRAKRTAEIVCETAGVEGKPVVENWLSCGMRPEVALKELAAYKDTCRTVALFGHEPDFSGLVEHLIGADYGSVRVKKASVILLSVDLRSGQGLLHFNIWPTQLPEVG